MIRKGFFIFMLLLGLVRQYTSIVGTTTPFEPPPTPSADISHVFARAPDTQAFICDGRQYCNQMHSLREADFFIRNCPNTRLDGDHDGLACENGLPF